MQSLKLRSHVGEDGVLKLHIPVDITNADVEVVVVFQAVARDAGAGAAEQPTESATQTPEERGWPPGFFERTAGSIPDFPLDRNAGLDPSLDDDVVLTFDDTNSADEQKKEQ